MVSQDVCEDQAILIIVHVGKTLELSNALILAQNLDDLVVAHVPIFHGSIRSSHNAIVLCMCVGAGRHIIPILVRE